MALWAYIAVGGGLLGGALLFRKLKEDATPAASETPSTDLCEKLRAIGGQQAVDACRAIKLGAAIVDAVIPNSTDSDNVRINGPAVVKVAPEIMAIYRLSNEHPAGPVSVLNSPYTIKYQNGCVPIPGHPDFAKCGAGTKTMVNEAWFRYVGHARGLSMSGVLTGDVPVPGSRAGRDPLTFTWPPNVPWPSSFPRGGTPYVSPEDPGTRFVFKGIPIVCPAGMRLASGTDHRTTPGPICAPAVNTVTPPPTVTMPTTEPVRTSTDGGRTADRRDPNR